MFSLISRGSISATFVVEAPFVRARLCLMPVQKRRLHMNLDLKYLVGGSLPEVYGV